LSRKTLSITSFPLSLDVDTAIPRQPYISHYVELINFSKKEENKEQEL